jgi:hypothetical protein
VTATTARPPGRLISKAVQNLKPGMRVCPARWKGSAEGVWVTVVGSPERRQFDDASGARQVEVRVTVLYPGKDAPTTLKVSGRGELQVDVVMPS